MANTSELISLLRNEKENIETVNSNLIKILEKKEKEINDLHNELLEVEQADNEKEKSLGRAHSIIRKLNEDYEKAIQDIQKLEVIIEKQKEERKDFQQRIKEMRGDVLTAETSKKSEERLRTENQKFKEGMIELARLTQEEREKLDIEREKFQLENEEYKYIITQLEEKLYEIEKVLHDRNINVQSLEKSLGNLKEEIESKQYFQHLFFYCKSGTKGRVKVQELSTKRRANQNYCQNIFNIFVNYLLIFLNYLIKIYQLFENYLLIIFQLFTTTIKHSKSKNFYFLQNN